MGACGAAAAVLAACGSEGPPGDANLIAGKQMFVQKCGSCHVLNRAGTTGRQGPSLDAAFSRSLADGFGRSAIRGVVHSQILNPANLDPDSPAYMPADLVTGKGAQDVAAYVASVVGRGGEDTGLLASAVKPAGSGKPVAAKGGVLALPADPNGQLAYISEKATAEAGELELTSENESSVPHNIALEGGGVEEIGEVVQGGGVSRITVPVRAGEYQFFCTVQGHREGGMEGTLTVK